MTPSWTSQEIILILFNRGLRSLTFGFLEVVLAIYLAELGVSPLLIGVTFTGSYVSTSSITIFGGLLADRYGRGRILMAYGVLLAACGAVFLFTREILILLVVTALGTLGTSGASGGPVGPAEQAILSDKVHSSSRTKAFGAISLVGAAASTAGSLIAGLPAFLRAAGYARLDAYMPLFAITVATGVSSALIMLRVKESTQFSKKKGESKLLSREARHIAARLSATGVIDYFGTTMVRPFYAYWFYLKFGVDTATLGALISISHILSAVSYIAAVRLASRFGTVNSIVLSRLPYIAFLTIMPLAPSFETAALFYLLRSLFGTMDTPLRQSYTMGIVRPEERASVAGISELSRNAPGVLGPSITGFVFQLGHLTIPFLSAGSLQLSEAVLFFKFFRRIRPPEEAGASLKT